ncbi:hypothetical protein [Salmonirosea aquatica]
MLSEDPGAIGWKHPTDGSTNTYKVPSDWNPKGTILAPTSS